jgi:hypothetical protein
MCDNDLPHFIMLLGEILMVKIGVSDHQQPLCLGCYGLFHKVDRGSSFEEYDM